MKLILTKGLPASGKTTWAREYGKDNPRINNICKDDIRKDYPYKSERDVLKIRDECTRSTLAAGCDVIWSDTNLNPIHEQTARRIAAEFGAEVEIKDFPLHYEECIRRDKKRPISEKVGPAVIMDMYYQYLYKQPIPIPQTNYPAFIVDIDGTLANHGQRDVYNTAEAATDTVIQPVKTLVNSMVHCGYYLFVFSGRDEKFRGLTEEWLKANGIDYWRLYMRPEGDTRPDYIIKRELFDKAFSDGEYSPLFVFDDRKQVKRMWVDMGLFVFDVNQRDIEF